MSNKHFNLIQAEISELRTASKLLYVSSAKYGGDWHSNPHTHNCSELFFVIGGIGQFHIKDKIHSVKTNDMVIVNPNIEHTEISFESNPLEYIVLGVDGLELSTTNNPDNFFCIVNFTSIRETLLFYLKSILKEIENKSLGYEIMCQNIMGNIIILLNRQTNFSTTLSPIRHSSNRLCDSIKGYIDTHFKENITLDTLAMVAHVSKYHLVHSFTKEYSVSPINYLIQCRIQEGCQLLKNTDYSLSLISQLLGFSSPSYFSQCFRKIMLMTPMEYRKSNSTKWV